MIERTEPYGGHMTCRSIPKPVLFSLLLILVAGAAACPSSSGDAENSTLPGSAGTGGQALGGDPAVATESDAAVGTGGATRETGTGGASGGAVRSGGMASSAGVARSGGMAGLGGTTRLGGVSGGAAGRTQVSSSGSASTGGSTSPGATTGAGGATGSTCIGSALLASVGKDTVLVGGSMEDATAAKAPFDGRYLYLSGGLFDGTTPCTSCASGCTTGGTSCSNSGSGCAWWGCWQWDQDPPGQYAVSFIGMNEKASPKQIPMFTYYEELQASGKSEGTAQVAAINDAAFLTRYLADWRFVLQKIGTHVAFLHIEPDFWGYVEQLNSDPHAVAAKVTAANGTDCASNENSAAGLAACMIHMVRVYAPNAKVGLHASAWGTKMDVFGNSDAKLDVPGEAKKMVSFLTALGAKDGDFIVVDPSDRDAGFYEKTQSRNTWWDDSNATLPNFHQAFTWTKAVAEGIGLPAIYWQIPVGNMSLDNTNTHYKDNRLDYFFAHMNEVAAAHIVGLYFGAGATGPTTPETDGGNFVSKTTAYRSAGGVKICP